MTKILSIDLGKFKSAACLYQQKAQPVFRTFATTPAALHDLLVNSNPTASSSKVCGIAGWIHDLCVSLDLPIAVVDTRHEAWRWNKVKHKTDRGDALKLARLTATDDISTVHMPERSTRQWRSAITYRHTLVDRRTAIKNTIRCLIDVQGLRMPVGTKAWSPKGVAWLRDQARDIRECDRDELWRGQLDSELRALADADARVTAMDTALDALARADDRVQRLKTIPGVGNRMAELIVAVIADPHRFKNGREVGAYAGLVPREFQPGMMQRAGRITKQGPAVLRRLLVQIAWGMKRRSARVSALFERLTHGQRTRRKKAIVAVARKILIWCWTMLRDGTTWREAAT